MKLIKKNDNAFVNGPIDWIYTDKKGNIQSSSEELFVDFQQSDVFDKDMGGSKVWKDKDGRRVT